MPDVSYVLLDGSVGGELAGAGRVHHGHSRPGLAVLEGFADASLRIRIGAEVREDEVLVRTAEAVREQRIIQRAEELGVGGAGPVTMPASFTSNKKYNFVLS